MLSLVALVVHLEAPWRLMRWRAVLTWPYPPGGTVPDDPQNDHRGPLAIIVIFGLLALVALGFAGALALLDHPLEVVIVFIGVCTTVAAYLAPSPLTKLPPSTPAKPVDAAP